MTDSHMQACLATIYFVAAQLLVSRHCHVGVRLAAAATILGAIMAGSLFAACAVSFATSQWQTAESWCPELGDGL